jgi:hypothetical protein
MPKLNPTTHSPFDAQSLTRQHIRCQYLVLRTALSFMLDLKMLICTKQFEFREMNMSLFYQKITIQMGMYIGFILKLSPICLQILKLLSKF